ncbi:MAG: peptidase M19 [Gammaproteobacteria bacterium]|nr:peptidase M19 [Gammaproteobacteria bacterium]
MKLFIGFAIILAILASARWLVPGIAEERMNRVERGQPWPVSDTAQRLHDSLVIMDWHSDFLLWDRSLLVQGNRGHTDLPRLQKGNVAVQMFTAVTKVPRNMNYQKNDEDGFDNITILAIAQTWPVSTWTDLKARALYQAERLTAFAARAPDELRIVTSREELLKGLEARKHNPRLVMALLGIEGSHALNGNLQGLEELERAGYRLFGLQHLFDNRLGGSLHGQTKEGLTSFGREVVSALNRRHLVIDLAHSSEAVVRDVLELTSRPVVISHGGIKGTCDSPRNISEDLMLEITRQGGLIAIGYWEAAVCDNTPSGIVKSTRHAIDLLGEDHVALGSDFDGAVAVRFDTAELAVLTQEMMKQGFKETEIRKVMGENSIRFLTEQLP